MLIDSTFLKYCLLITALFILPLTAVSQADNQGEPPAQQKPKVVFSNNIALAKRELDWSKTYYLSFRKTKEAIYLKLAATHCGNAVNVLKATQTSFPRTTRFYYQAKNKRFSACRFYQELQETALRLAPHHHIKEAPNNGCDF